MKSQQIDLFEENYCQLRAMGTQTQLSCYQQALAESSKRPTEKDETIRTRIKRLEKEPKIIARIAEIKRLDAERKAELWSARKEELCERMYRGIIDAAEHRIATGKDTYSSILDAKGTIELLGRLKGWEESRKVEIATTDVGKAVSEDERNGKLQKLLVKNNIHVGVAIGDNGIAVAVGIGEVERGGGGGDEDEVEKVGGGGDRDAQRGRDIPVASEQDESTIIDVTDPR